MVVAAGVPLSVAGVTAEPVAGVAAYDAERVLVRFVPGTTEEQRAASFLGAAAIETVFTYSLVPGLVCVRVPADGVRHAVEAFRADPAVMYAEYDYIRSAEAQTTPYGIEMVLCQPVWPTGRGAGGVVAVLDTGVDLTHPDLPAALLTTSFIGGQSVDDLHSHGTHCAGTVLALDNTIGVVGVAPECGLMVAKVLSNGGSGPTSGVMAGANWAVVNGAHVISMSLGGGGFSQAESDVYSAAVAANVLVVAAAGNANSSTPSYPGAYEPVLSVAAVDQNKVKASFSNFGPTIDITGPGVNVNSTIPLISANATWDGLARSANIVTGGYIGAAAGNAVFCGYGGSAADFPPSVSGHIAHIRRGSGDGSSITFFTKADNAFDAGAVGVIISNNVAGNFSGGLNASFPIPVVSISQADGDNLQANNGTPASVNVFQSGSGYGNKSGTSMSTPHVAGVAGLLVGVFGHDNLPVAQLRAALENSAEDLGDAGRDDIFGHGLVNAAAAKAYLDANLNNCGSADFDGDGDTGTDLDIEAFFACLGGNCCASCGSADFDGDGDTGTDQDIEAFFRVLGGQAC